MNQMKAQQFPAGLFGEWSQVRISRTASSGLAAIRRAAAAMLLAGTAVSRWTTVLRRAASTSGEDPDRTRLASSPRVTSRTWCRRFSMDLPH